MSTGVKSPMLTTKCDLSQYGLDFKKLFLGFKSENETPTTSQKESYPSCGILSSELKNMIREFDEMLAKTGSRSKEQSLALNDGKRKSKDVDEIDRGDGPAYQSINKQSNANQSSIEKLNSGIIVGEKLVEKKADVDEPNDKEKSKNICTVELLENLKNLKINAKESSTKLSEHLKTDENLKGGEATDEDEDGDEEKCEFIPRGIEVKAKKEKKPYDRPNSLMVLQGLVSAQVNGLYDNQIYLNDPLAVYGQDIQIVPSGCGGYAMYGSKNGGMAVTAKNKFSGGTVQVNKSPDLVSPPPPFSYTPAQVVHTRLVGDSLSSCMMSCQHQSQPISSQVLPVQVHMQPIKSEMSPPHISGAVFQPITFPAQPSPGQCHPIPAQVLPVYSPASQIKVEYQLSPPKVSSPPLPQLSPQDIFFQPDTPAMGLFTLSTQILELGTDVFDPLVNDMLLTDLLNDGDVIDFLPSTPSSGYGSPPYDPFQTADPLTCLELVVDEKGQGRLEVSNPGSYALEMPVETALRRYMHFVSKGTSTRFEEEEENLIAHRNVALLTTEQLTKLDGNGNTVIIEVAFKCTYPVLKALLDRYQRSGLLEEFINKENNSKRMALHYALYLEDAKKTRLLVERGANVNADYLPKVATPGGEAKFKRESLIGYAASRGGSFLPILTELLCSPIADLDLMDSDGYTPLHTAILNHNVENVNHLILRGADITAQNQKNSKTPLYCAVECGNLDLVDHLFKVIQVVYQDDFEARIKSMVQPGFSLLKLAYDLDFPDPKHKFIFIELLLRHGAELTQKSSDSALRREFMNIPWIAEVMKSISAAKKKMQK